MAHDIHDLRYPAFIEDVLARCCSSQDELVAVLGYIAASSKTIDAETEAWVTFFRELSPDNLAVAGLLKWDQKSQSGWLGSTHMTDLWNRLTGERWSVIRFSKQLNARINSGEWVPFLKYERQAAGAGFRINHIEFEKLFKEKESK